MIISEKLIENLRYRYWLNGIIPQHDLSSVKKSLDTAYEYKDCKLGNIQKGEGDVVIIGLKKKPELEHYDFWKCFKYTHMVDRIETIGIFTNIYWSKKFFSSLVEYINDK